MCGIVGALAFGKMNKKDEAIRQRVMRYFTEELLIETEDRGKDATGAAILFEGGNYVGIKRGDKATTFLSKFGRNKDTYGGFLEIWRKCDKPVKVYLGHCRAGTVGEKEENANNHPIKIDNIIGVHNGVIKNDDKIIENLGCKRDGKVDSEAIFRLFEHFTNKGKEPFTLPMVQKVVNRLDGQFAVALFNADNPYQVPIFRDGRPVEFFLIKDYGLLFIVSEIDFWNAVHFRYERAIFDHGLNLPSFIDTPIEKEDLDDDSCLIFDLTNKVNGNTKIKDLGKWSKMDRNNKIWKDKVVGYQSTNNYRRNTNANRSGDINMTKDGGEKKTRVFDNIQKKYVSKVGDKVLKDDEEAVLPVDKDASSSTILNQEGAIKSTDDGAEETNIQPIGINDSTNYGTGGKKDEKEVKKEANEKDRQDKGKVGEESGKVVEVDMTQDSKELVEAAENTFKSLDSAQKGYADIGEVLDKLDIQDSKIASEIGMVAIANRSFRYAWKKGFIKACKCFPSYAKTLKNDIKVAKREKYITSLKSLVILLAMHFDKIKALNSKDRIEGLRMITKKYFDHKKNAGKIDMESVSDVFSIAEKSKIKAATAIIEDIINKTDVKNKAAKKKKVGRNK